MITKRIHQIFLPFPPDHKTIDEFPLFLKSRAEFESLNPAWEDTLWTEDELDDLIGKTPWLFEFYNQVRYPVLKVDIAKYILGNCFGGVVSDFYNITYDYRTGRTMH